MKLRKLSVLILSSALFAGTASTSFAQQSHRNGGQIGTPAVHKMQSDKSGNVFPVSTNANSQSAVFYTDSDYPLGFNGNTASGNSGKTRAQVQAELEEARAQGLLDFNDSSYGSLIDTINSQTAQEKSRAQVLSELNQARAQGLLSFNDSQYPLQRNAMPSAGGSNMMNMADGSSNHEAMC